MTDNFEGFIELGENLEDVQEPKLLPTARYRLRIDAAVGKTDESGNLSQINCRIVAVDKGPDYAPIFHTVWLPKADADADSRKYTLLKVRRFMVLFKIPVSPTGVTTTDFLGREADANVNLGTYQKKDGSGEGQSNAIVIPSLPR